MKYFLRLNHLCSCFCLITFKVVVVLHISTSVHCVKYILVSSDQCNQIGRCMNISLTNFHAKKAQMLGNWLHIYKT